MTVVKKATVFLMENMPDYVHTQNSSRTLCGTVTSVADSEPLSGVNISITGTSVGTSGNAEGKLHVLWRQVCRNT